MGYPTVYQYMLWDSRITTTTTTTAINSLLKHLTALSFAQKIERKNTCHLTLSLIPLRPG